MAKKQLIKRLLQLQKDLEEERDGHETRIEWENQIETVKDTIQVINLVQKLIIKTEKK